MGVAFILLAGLLVGGCAAKKVTELENQLQGCETDLAKIKKNVGEDRTDARIKDYKKARDVVEKAFAAEDVKAEVVLSDGLLSVRLPNDVMFESGAADLNAEGKKSLDTMAAVLLKDTKDRQFMVAGHTDSDPVGGSTYQDNWELSTERALSALRYLVEKGVKASNLAAAGYGAHSPLGSNDNDEGKAENRRTEVVFLPTPGERAKQRAGGG